MELGDPLGCVEFAVIDAVNRGALRSRQTADRVPGLRRQPAGDALVHEVLRAEGRFRAALLGVLLRS